MIGSIGLVICVRKAVVDQQEDACAIFTFTIT